MFIKVRSNPKNPKHFISLCFLECKKNPDLKKDNTLCKKVYESKNMAIFNSYYGFFILNKNGFVSPIFYKDIEDFFPTRYWSLRMLPQSTLDEWIWDY